MREIRDHCAAMPVENVAAGAILPHEGQKTARAYVPIEGAIEGLRGETQVFAGGQPGAFQSNIRSAGIT